MNMVLRKKLLKLNCIPKFVLIIKLKIYSCRQAGKFRKFIAKIIRDFPKILVFIVSLFLRSDCNKIVRTAYSDIFRCLFSINFRKMKVSYLMKIILRGVLLFQKNILVLDRLSKILFGVGISPSKFAVPHPIWGVI